MFVLSVSLVTGLPASLEAVVFLHNWMSVPNIQVAVYFDIYLNMRFNLLDIKLLSN